MKSASQPEPKKLRASIAQFLEQFRLIRRALTHPKVPWHAKAVAGCAIAYIVSPIQLIPNFIPVIGQMDDVLAVVLAIKYLKRHVPQDVLDECRNNVRAKAPEKAAQEDSKPAVTTAHTT